MKNKIMILSFAAFLLLSGCSYNKEISTEEYKYNLEAEYPAYDFESRAEAYLHYPTFEELKERAAGDFSFIVAQSITSLEPITFTYTNTEDDEAVIAIETKLESLGITPDNSVTLYPYEIEYEDIYGEKDITGKVILLTSKFFSKVPEIDGTMGILVSTDTSTIPMWEAAYEEVNEAADTYVYLVHSELSYYYITDENTVVPMCNSNDEDYQTQIGLTLSEFEKYIN